MAIDGALSSLASKVPELREAKINYDLSNNVQTSYHVIHLANGSNYRPDCPECNK